MRGEEDEEFFTILQFLGASEEESEERDIAEDWDSGRGYKYPIVSSHSSVGPDYDRVAEGGTFWSEAVRIRDLGGVISVPQARKECGTTRKFIEGRSDVEDAADFVLGLSHLEDLSANRFSQE